jgi:hypothetical protein
MHDESALARLTELSGVEILWFFDFYDGAIVGLARWEGREFWFAGVHPLDRRPRRYVLHEISAADVHAASALHRRLAAYADAARRGLLDSAQERAWGRAWASRPDYRRAPAVGWFAA